MPAVGGYNGGPGTIRPHIRPMDVSIAAVAEVQGLTVVTRNAAEFAPLPRRVFNPWHSDR